MLQISGWRDKNACFPWKSDENGLLDFAGSSAMAIQPMWADEAREFDFLGLSQN